MTVQHMPDIYDINSFPAVQHFQRLAQTRCLQQLVQAALREQLLGCVNRGGGEQVVPLWRSRKLLLLRGARLVSLARLEGIAGIELIDHITGECRPLEDVQEFLSLLALEQGASTSDASWRSLKEELVNGIFNNAMCMAYRQRWNRELSAQVANAGMDSFWRWVCAGGCGQDAPLFFEQWAAIGHPYHPCSKTKLGLNPAEVLQYSPEFQGGASVRLVAVRKSHLHVQQGVIATDSAAVWLQQHYPEWLRQWQSAMQAQGLDDADFAPVPVHAWQADSIVPERFKAEIAAGHIALLEGPELATGATMSFRTMAPVDHARAPHIKLPVAVQATSAMRTVSPASVRTGPQVVAVLQAICTDDASIGAALQVLPESVGMHFQRPDGHPQDDDMRFLSALFRHSPASCVYDGEMALAVAALFVESPVSGQSLVFEIMAAAGAETEAQVLQYFADYVARVLEGHLDLFLRYGIALEAHQQNAVAVFDSRHRLTRVLARDFGGIRIDRARLTTQGFAIEAYPGAVTLTDDTQEVRSKFVHAVLQGHLGEMVLCLHRGSGIDEQRLWQVVARAVMERFESLKSVVPEPRWHEERTAILEHDWRLKALTRMRLDETSHHYIYVQLDNPLKGLADAV